MTTLMIAATFLIANSLEEPTKVDWLTGKSLKRAKQLAISARWSEVPLRDRLLRLAYHQGIPIFLDRRIDPSTPMNLNIQQKTWEQLLWTVAKNLHLEICQIDDLYYFTQPGQSLPIRLTFDKNREQLRKNRKGLKVPWMSPKSFEIPEFSRPRLILEKLANQHQITIIGLEKIPLDVWPAYNMPPIDLLQQFTLLLSGFGLYPAISSDGSVVTLQELPTLQTGRLRIPVTDNPKSLAKSLAPEFPNLAIRTYSQGLIIEGPVNEIRGLRARVVEMQTPVIGAESKKDFSVTSSRGNILATMAQQLGTQFIFAPNLRPILEEQVTIKLSGATEEDVIRKVLEGTQLSYKLSEDKLEIIED